MESFYTDMKDVLDILYPNYPFMYYDNIKDEIYAEIRCAFSDGTLSWTLGISVVHYRNPVPLEQVINKIVNRITRFKLNAVQGMQYFIGFRKFDGAIIRKSDINIHSKK